VCRVYNDTIVLRIALKSRTTERDEKSVIYECKRGLPRTDLRVRVTRSRCSSGVSAAYDDDGKLRQHARASLTGVTALITLWENTGAARARPPPYICSSVDNISYIRRVLTEPRVPARRNNALLLLLSFLPRRDNGASR